MVPLAWALRAAGHDVTFVTAVDGLAVTRAGLPALDALPGRTAMEMMSGFARDLPELFAPMGDHPVEEMDRRKPAILSAWDPYVDEHVALAERIRPDLVLYDPMFGVGPLVAAKLGIPAVAHSVSLSRFPPELHREMPAAVAFRRHGVEVPEGIRTIDVAPASLVEGPPSDLAMRYVPYNGAGVLPEWLLTPPQRPRIAVSFGSLAPKIRGFGYVDFIAAAAPEVDAEFVVTLGDDAAGAPSDLPPNVRTTGWMPLNALLRTCAAAIHHGGDGTVMTSCALGVPQLVLPTAPDEVVIAELLRRRGAAHVMRGEELDAVAIRGLLADDKLRRVADEVKAEIAALPAPSELVPMLTSLR
jgi:UDP:flavonoid glycosyltransferase YjiC (YdhE family)